MIEISLLFYMFFIWVCSQDKNSIWYARNDFEDLAFSSCYWKESDFVGRRECIEHASIKWSKIRINTIIGVMLCFNWAEFRSR